MRTENKKTTETIEFHERNERINDNTENNSNTGTELDEIWSKIGDMTLSEGTKYAWHLIKNLKVKSMVLVIVTCAGFGLAGVIVFHVSRLLFPLIWEMANNCYTMAVGNNNEYLYSFFDGDLINTIPFSLIIAIIVGIFSKRNKFLFIILYFMILFSMLEIWDYWHFEYGVNEILGSLCFVIMFIIIPILYIIRWFIPILIERPE